MAVREFWEIKWIQWITVQENWVTQVSIADTVNIVWWGTVTDVWWVATINIPYWVTWYREDVSAGSATYTFINSPATATSFLVFTDSGTLMFSWIDYTYDVSTETITFLSLGSNEAAYIWVAHAVTTWWGVWDMVKAVYDPTNINRSAFDYNNFINTPTIWNATLKIQKNGTDVNSITMNATTDVTANITVPTTVAELSDANDYVKTTDITDMVEWPSSATDWNIAVFDGATGKLIKDSWLNIQVVNTLPSWDQVDIYYDNWTIYIYQKEVSYIITESGNGIITEDGKNLILEN